MFSLVYAGFTDVKMPEGLEVRISSLAFLYFKRTLADADKLGRLLVAKTDD